MRRQSTLLNLLFWSVLLQALPCSVQAVELPLAGPPADGHLRQVRIALLDLVLIRADLKGEDQIAVSLPDEIAVRRGDEWVFAPSATIIPPTEIVHAALRHAGFSVDRYTSLHHAKANGARLAIMGAVTPGSVTIGAPGLLSTMDNLRIMALSLGTVQSEQEKLKVRAESRLQAAIIDLQGPKVVWSGPVTSMEEKEIFVKVFSRKRHLREAEAASRLGELYVHPARVVLTSTYYSLGMSLASKIEEIMAQKSKP
ncbi:MAG TPA: hypothetical protein VGJ57_08835 [Nitrospirales bacterium]